MKSSHSTLSAACTIAAAVLALGVAPARAGYTITPLTVPGLAAGDYVSANSINNAGQILLVTGPNTTGTVDGTYIFTPSTNTYTALPSDPAAVSGMTFPSGLNNSGQVVGNYQPTDLGTYQSYLYSAGSFTDVSPPPSLDNSFSAAFAINDSGAVVGTWETSSDSEQGYLFSGGVYTTIDAPGVGIDTELYGINNNGDIVGVDYPHGSVVPSNGFEYSGGVFSAITVPGEANVAPYGINDSGEIIGVASNDDNFIIGDVAFIEIGGSTTIFNIPGATYTELDGVNDAGDLVGYYENADGSGGAFLATPNGSAPDASRTAGLLLLGLLGLGLVRAAAPKRNRSVA